MAKQGQSHGKAMAKQGKNKGKARAKRIWQAYMRPKMGQYAPKGRSQCVDGAEIAGNSVESE
jgi:hypothetical protein